MLRQISQPKCFPISLAQARKHLAVDSSDRSNDTLINLLIESATADSQMKTGRVWVESDWEWKPDVIGVNHEIAFPIVPVVDVRLYDLDEEITEPDNPEIPEIPDVPDYGNPDEDIPTRKKKRKHGRNVDFSKYTDIAEEYLTINYPSPDPLGLPIIGSIIPIQVFPENYKLVLTVGYPVESHEEVVEQFDNPVLVTDKTSYGDNLIRLVFNRPVQGEVTINNFELRVRGQIVTLINAYFIDGCVQIEFDPMSIQPEVERGDPFYISFFEGSIYDQFQNFVQPIINAELPQYQPVGSIYFNTPDPVPMQEVFESLAPSPVKNWILTRVGSLYSQRTEIALRAGKSNDAMFPDQFINNLLDPYRVRFFE